MGKIIVPTAVEVKGLIRVLSKLSFIFYAKIIRGRYWETDLSFRQIAQDTILTVTISKHYSDMRFVW